MISDHYRPLIAAIIARVGTADMRLLRKVLREEFPDPPHKYHPYKIWLDEIAVQLGTKGKRKRNKKERERKSPDNAAVQGNLFEE